MRKIKKALSGNDLGITGSHQAGMAVPKSAEILSFFPKLNGLEKNPRAVVLVRERGDGAVWRFNFIYYNGKFFGGTRNEYRLTGMTRYLRSVGANVGDCLVFEKNPDDGAIEIHLDRLNSKVRDDGVLVLSGGWKLVS